jgi:hypothetical protein
MNSTLLPEAGRVSVRIPGAGPAWNLQPEMPSRSRSAANNVMNLATTDDAFT